MGGRGSVELAIASFLPFWCDGALASTGNSDGGSDDRDGSVIFVWRCTGGAGADLASCESLPFFFRPTDDDDGPDVPRAFLPLDPDSFPSVVVAVDDRLCSFLTLASLFLRGFF